VVSDMELEGMERIGEEGVSYLVVTHDEETPYIDNMKPLDYEFCWLALDLLVRNRW